MGSRGTCRDKGGEQEGTGAGGPTVLPVPSSVLAKGEEDAHAGKIARSAVTACFPLTGESHQHLGIQELLHRAGPSPWGCGSCEANGKFGRVSVNLPMVCGDGQRGSCVFTTTSWQKC